MLRTYDSLSLSQSVFKEREIRKRDKCLPRSREVALRETHAIALIASACAERIFGRTSRGHFGTFANYTCLRTFTYCSMVHPT